MSLDLELYRIAGVEPVGGLVDAIPLAVLCFDADGQAIFANAAWTALSGRPLGCELGSGWVDAFAAEERTAIASWVRSGIAERRLAAREAWAATVIGTRLLRLTGQPHLDGTGALLSYVVCAADVTEEVSRQERLAHAARHDALTGLANRAGFLEQAARLTCEAARTGRGAALLLLDLDDFKVINDQAGHSAGDEVLRTVAARLQASLRPTDVAARFGGDEFALLLAGVRTTDAAGAVAGRMLHRLTQPISLHGRRWQLSASIGTVVAVTDDVEDLLQRADKALYTAKARGKNAVVIEQQRPGIPMVTQRSAPRLESTSDAAPFHGVTFYGDDAELLQTLVEYVGGGLRDECTILIATAEHRDALRRRLASAALERARAQGRYLEFDAAETLARFMRCGLPDPDLFHMAVGAVVRHARARHGRLRAYGEMVALLWAAGNAAGALRLEELLNDLQREVDFPRLCAYPTRDVPRGQGDGFEQVCHRHTRIVAPA